ncbi:ATP-dependent endonuclease [Microvirga sp. VF16]|uniref:ATP-dependent nuclease n=1 Tax=Microvirga sp. VF16 TaxID=2807101 RepID=UPI00193C9F31|nr:AAA family ATPase [Microvirga sp. VF16]QRM32955.1 AAA family ATPase [Microvirga sp. VF16]
MTNRSKLTKIFIRNIGCIGDEGLSVDLDNIVCLVGRNNAGKSTILKAYELACGKASFDASVDRCQWSPSDAPSEIILDVHIPEGIGNVDAKWKQDQDGLLIVRSRWQWALPTFSKVRTTWDPDAKDWAVDGKAGGADPVFNSRLPRPLRIGSLDDAKTSEETLLQLALSPFVRELKALEGDLGSPLSNAVAELVNLVNKLTNGHGDRFNEIADKVGKGFQGVFPRLGVRLDVNMARPSFKLGDLLKEGSGLRISDGKTETSLIQQGTGTRRALFWSMLQVHNEISRASELAEVRRKELDRLQKDLEKEQKKAKPDETKLIEINARIEGFESTEGKSDADDPALPGYLLLIDEPENALHPMAARAAQKHLYRLADDPDWQIILTTHSPYFINPLADHTTIVRLERASEDETAPVTPRIFRSDTIGFDADTKRRLQALQQMDSSLAEIFFGSYPVLVEGDTEHAAFLAAVLETNHDLADRITVVRARGKAILVPLIRIMNHFRVPFGIIHDADTPFKLDGVKNGMWTENDKIRSAITDCRANGIRVYHRVSIPDFERFLGGESLGKDKPLAAYEMIAAEEKLKVQVQSLLSSLMEGEAVDPFDENIMASGVYLDVLKEQSIVWAKTNGAYDDPRYQGKTLKAAGNLMSAIPESDIIVPELSQAVVDVGLVHTSVSPGLVLKGRDGSPEGA